VTEHAHEILTEAYRRACSLIDDLSGECPMSYNADVPAAAEGRFSVDDCEATCTERTQEGGGMSSADCWHGWFLWRATEEVPDRD